MIVITARTGSNIATIILTELSTFGILAAVVLFASRFNATGNIIALTKSAIAIPTTFSISSIVFTPFWSYDPVSLSNYINLFYILITIFIYINIRMYIGRFFISIRIYRYWITINLIRKIFSISIIIIFIFSSLVSLTSNDKEKSSIINEKNISKIMDLTYPNNDKSVLWMRHNGSDAGFPYRGANVPASLGMNFFGTNILQVGWDFNLTELETTTLIPPDAQLYIQISYLFANINYVTAVANLALTDHRIIGCWIDDFPVGQVAAWEIADIYSAVHSKDNVGYSHTLKLAIVIYQYNYFIQSPVPWTDYINYFDIIQFWFYPRSYPLLYSEFYGYYDDFQLMRASIPGKEYWIGIYLHYYNVGEYPYTFTNDQMNIALKLLRGGSISKITILENFWIQWNIPTAQIIKKYLDEYNYNYVTKMYSETNIQSFINGNNGTLTTTLINNVSKIIPFSDGVYNFTGYNVTFYSKRLQDLWVFGYGTIVINDRLTLVDMRTGEYDFGIQDDYYFCYKYHLEEGKTYKLVNIIHSVYYIYGTVDLTDTGFSNGEHTINGMHFMYNTSTHIMKIFPGIYIISGKIYINATVDMLFSEFIFTVDNYIDHTYLHTKPAYGFIFESNNINLRFYMQNCIVSGQSKTYPYLFYRYRESWNGKFNGTGDFPYEQWVFIENSIIAGYWDNYKPSGILYFENTTFYGVQPSGTNVHSGLWIESPSNYIGMLEMYNVTVWNYEIPGVCGVFIMPAGLWNDKPLFVMTGMTLIEFKGHLTPTDVVFYGLGGVLGFFSHHIKVLNATGYYVSQNKFLVSNLTIVGGNWGLWTDTTYSLSGTKIDNLTCIGEDLQTTQYFNGTYIPYGNHIFITFRLDGTQTIIFVAKMKTLIASWSIYAPYYVRQYFEVQFKGISNGIYALTIDGVIYYNSVEKNTLTILYVGSWSPTRNNFTLQFYGTTSSSQTGISNLIWLIIMFSPAMLLTQAIPKIGFIFGISIMILIIGISDLTFFPYMFVSFFVIAVLTYKELG